MNSFENSPQILAIKAELRSIFLSIIEIVKVAFISFYDWLKTVPIPAPPTMLKMFSNNKSNLVLFFLVLIYALFINIYGFVRFAQDKHYAIKHMERIRETTLFKYMWAGGAFGCGLSMVLNHHKTQHTSFKVTAIGLILVQLTIFSFFLGFLGFWAFF